MKTITFRPLRRIKKTGKIAVASYSQWNSIRTADYNKFNLIINDEYKTLHLNELVYNHNGEQLFWRDYDPSSIPVFTHNVLLDIDSIRENNQNYGIDWNTGYGINYFSKGLDCAGTPTFSHNTADDIANGHNDLDKINEFEPLTVGMVVKWFGWFLYQLENSNLQIGK